MFLKNDEAAASGPSQVHIRFEAIDRILPAEKSNIDHTIYINGKPADADCDRLQQLQAVDGKDKPRWMSRWQSDSLRYERRG